MFSRVWYGFPVQRLIADRVLDFSTRAGSEQGAGSLFEIQITGWDCQTQEDETVCSKSWINQFICDVNIISDKMMFQRIMKKIWHKIEY